jgi:hypothetical protein
MVFSIIFLLRLLIVFNRNSETDFLIILCKKVKLKNNIYGSRTEIKPIILISAGKNIYHFLFDWGSQGEYPFPRGKTN